jgi:hypothetical protein
VVPIAVARPTERTSRRESALVFFSSMFFAFCTGFLSSKK